VCVFVLSTGLTLPDGKTKFAYLPHLKQGQRVHAILRVPKDEDSDVTLQIDTPDTGGARRYTDIITRQVLKPHSDPPPRPQTNSRALSLRSLHFCLLSLSLFSLYLSLLSHSLPILLFCPRRRQTVLRHQIIHTRPRAILPRHTPFRPPRRNERWRRRQSPCAALVVLCQQFDD
jgi:hypothetical protein